MNRTAHTCTWSIVVAALVGGSWGQVARADFIPVRLPTGDERGHASILEQVLSPGISWTSFAYTSQRSRPAVDWTNGTLTAIRLDDSGLGGVLDVNVGGAGSADDSRWSGGPVTARALARFADYDQEFGYARGSGQFTKLFDVSGYGFAVSGSAGLTLPAGKTWYWGRAGDGQTWFSKPARNSDHEDHLVTYQITGLNDGLNHWMLFWEDFDHLGDKDYNDLVVGLTAPVPEPAAVLLVAAGCVALAWQRQMVRGGCNEGARHAT